MVFNYCPDSSGDVWPSNLNRIDNQHNLRNINHFIIPYPRIELSKRSPLYSIPMLWNNIGDLGLQSCKTTFRIGLKEKLFSENEIEIQHIT
jgi:hypothetical protein